MLPFHVEAPVVWRNLSFSRHSPGVWLTADRRWKLTNVMGEPHWVAYLQLDEGLFISESAETAALALDRLVVKADGYSRKLLHAVHWVAAPSRGLEHDAKGMPTDGCPGVDGPCCHIDGEDSSEA